MRTTCLMTSSGPANVLVLSCSLPARANATQTLSTGAEGDGRGGGDALDLDELEGDDDEGLGRARGAAGRDGEALVHLALAGEREELLAPEVVRGAACAGGGGVREGSRGAGGAARRG